MPSPNQIIDLLSRFFSNSSAMRMSSEEVAQKIDEIQQEAIQRVKNGDQSPIENTAKKELAELLTLLEDLRSSRSVGSSCA